MTEVNTKWNLGNFTVGLATQADEPMMQKLATLGLLYVGQRVSEVDKILGGFTKDADGKAKRIPGWKRGDTAFSEALAEKLKSAFFELELPDETPLECKPTVVEYSGPAKAEPKFAREKKKFAEKEALPGEDPLGDWLKSFAKFEGESHGEDGEYSVEALAAAKAAIDRFLAENI